MTKKAELLGTTAELPGQSVRDRADWVAHRITDGLGTVASWLETRTWPAILIILLCFLPLVLLQCHSQLLSNDEIYTVHIAQQPTLGKMLAVARELDLHPPLHYLAVREAMRLPIPRGLSARLPNVLSGLVLCFGLFVYASRRLGKLFGLLAVGIFWLTPVVDLTWCDRPYMLWLALLWLLLLCWDAERQLDRLWWAVPCALLLATAMVSTHLLGIACLGLLLVAEGVRSLTQRRIDWPFVLAIAAPIPLGLTMHYQLHELSKNTFPPSQQASFALLAQLFGLALSNAITVLAICALLVFLLFGHEVGYKFTGEDTQRTIARMGNEDIVFLLLLLILPILLFLPAVVLHLQFWLRYDAASMPAFGVLAAWVVARRLPFAKPMAVVLVAACAAFMVYRIIVDTAPMGNAGVMAGGRMPIPLGSLDPSLLIVSASPMTFVEMSDREPLVIAQRVFYLTDRNAADQYAHYTLFENEDKVRRLLNLPSHVEPLGKFVTEHPRFYMVGDYSRPEIWLPRKLAADGWKLNYLGKFESSYQTDDLFLVTR